MTGFIKIPNWAVRGVLHPREFAVYAVLLSHANVRRESYPMHETIAKEACLNLRQVPDAIAELVDEGLIERRRRQRSNLYLVNRFADERPEGYRSRFERGERVARRLAEPKSADRELTPRQSANHELTSRQSANRRTVSPRTDVVSVEEEQLEEEPEKKNTHAQRFAPRADDDEQMIDDSSSSAHDLNNSSAAPHFLETATVEQIEELSALFSQQFDRRPTSQQIARWQSMTVDFAHEHIERSRQRLDDITTEYLDHAVA